MKKKMIFKHNLQFRMIIKMMDLKFIQNKVKRNWIGKKKNKLNQMID